MTGMKFLYPGRVENIDLQLFPVLNIVNLNYSVINLYSLSLLV